MITDDLAGFWDAHGGATEKEIQRAESRLRVRFPHDLRLLLRRSNGALWYVGHRCVHVWDVQRIEAYNCARPVRISVPGLVGIADDMRTGTAYALDFRTGAATGVVEVPLPALDPINPCGNSVSAWLLASHYEALDRAFLDHVRRGSAPDIVGVLDLIPSWNHHAGAAIDEIREAEATLGVSFPHDYKQALRWSDGFDCEAGAQYLRLSRVGELAHQNREHQVDRYMAGAVMIGSDAGDTCFALHYGMPEAPPRVISCDMGGLDLEDAEVCGPSLEACLQKWSGIERAALAGGRSRLLRCLSGRPQM